MGSALRIAASLYLCCASVLCLADDDARWHELYRELTSLAQAHSVPALALVIMDHGRPVLVGMTGPGDERGGAAGKILEPRTPFRWGSISKAVTALTLLEATRRHGVSLRAPVADFLDELPYQNPWAEKHPMRLNHLLELSAGLPDLRGEEFSDNQPLPLQAALRRFAGQREVLWPPGLQHSYSNVPPGISAAVVERLTGRTFEQAAGELVFHPLGMDDASYLPVTGLPGGYQADGRTQIPYWHMTFRAFGALNASAAAMARLLEALLNQGQISGGRALAPESVARLHRLESTLGARAGLEIGYGAGVYGWVRNGHLLHGHGGDADGYQSRFGLLLDAGRGYLVGINTDNPPLLRRMQRQIEETLTADLEAPAPPPAHPLTPAELNRFAGEYYPSAARFDVAGWQAGRSTPARLELKDGGLVFRRSRTRQPLIPVSPTAFRRPGDPAVSVVFVEHNGKVFLQGELGSFSRIEPPPCPAFVPACNQGWPLSGGFGKVGAAQ